MLRSIWRWIERDRIFAFLVAGILIVGAILMGLVYILTEPTKQTASPITPTPPTNNTTLTPTSSDTVDISATTPTTANPEVTASTELSPTADAAQSPTLVIADPALTQIASLPNQGQNPAPPPPPTPSPTAKAPAPVATSKIPATPTRTVKR
jgi:hypothetical protein